MESTAPVRKGSTEEDKGTNWNRNIQGGFNKMKYFLLRISSDENQTLGSFQFYDGVNRTFECNTLELPWLDNARQISCIPTGEYSVEKHTSPTFGLCFRVKDVNNRSDILIHKGNYKKNTKGCILPGSSFADINDDGLLDVIDSTGTLDKLLAITPNEFLLTITN